MTAEPDAPPQDLEDPVDDDPVAPVRLDLPRGGPSEPEKTLLRSRLMDLRNQILRTGKDLEKETLKQSGQSFKVDHMADAGSDNFEQDMNLSLLAGEAELLRAIEAAIRNIDGQGKMPYGLCEECARQQGVWDEDIPAPWIPTSRLEALPYARLCVAHQEEQEEG